MTGIEVRIIKNLKERVHPVNDNTALSGIEDTQAGFAALRELITNGIVEVNLMKADIPNQDPITIKLYTLSYDARFTDIGIRRIK